MIYFMQPVGGGPIKIGTSGNVEKRKCELECYYQRHLVILATMPGGLDEEATIHERFAHLRFGKTEQFRPAPELMEFIGRSELADADPAGVRPLQALGAKPRLSIEIDDELARMIDDLSIWWGGFRPMPKAAVIRKAVDLFHAMKRPGNA